MSLLRRYEILVPLVFDDGSPVPETLLTETFLDLRKRFGAASWETQTLRGVWEYEGAVHQDNLTRFFVDVPDRPENREFFVNFKALLKQRFNQLEIWITSGCQKSGRKRKNIL
jgi:hypothetical protein